MVTERSVAPTYHPPASQIRYAGRSTRNLDRQDALTDGNTNLMYAIDAVETLDIMTK